MMAQTPYIQCSHAPETTFVLQSLEIKNEQILIAVTKRIFFFWKKKHSHFIGLLYPREHNIPFIQEH